MLLSTIGFATNDVVYLEKDKTLSEINSGINVSATIVTGEVMKSSEYTCTVYHYVLYDGEQVGQFTTEEPDDSPNCNGIVYHVLKKAD